MRGGSVRMRDGSVRVGRKDERWEFEGGGWQVGGEGEDVEI